MPPGQTVVIARGPQDAAAWSEAAEDSLARIAVLVLGPGDDVEIALADLEEALGEELAEPVLVLHDDDEHPVEVLDLLDPAAPYDAPADAVEALTEAVLACTLDEALVGRWQLGLGLSPDALRAAVIACVRDGLLPVVIPVLGTRPDAPGTAALQRLLEAISL
jgi:hypothetical protein